jgi:DNA-binding transcriptional regulator YiaG
MTPDEITRAREDLHLTQRALAERLGVSANTVWRWEAGTVPPPAYLRIVFDGLTQKDGESKHD